MMSIRFRVKRKEEEAPEEAVGDVKIVAIRSLPVKPPRILNIRKLKEESYPAEVGKLLRKYPAGSFVNVRGRTLRIDKVSVQKEYGIVAGYNIHELEKKGVVERRVTMETDDNTVMEYHVSRGYVAVLAEQFDENILYVIYG